MKLLFVAAGAVEGEDEGRVLRPLRPCCDIAHSIGSRIAFQLVAQVRVLGRQFQRLAEVRGILVDVEAGLVGRDFEQHSARRAEVDRPEIVPVDHRSDRVARVDQRLAHLELPRPVLDREGDVVDRACSLSGMGRARQRLDVDGVGAVAARHLEAGDVAVFARFFVAHEAQQFGRSARIAQAHVGGVEAADRHVLAHAVARPGRTVVVAGGDQREGIAIGTVEQDAILPEAGVT